jgi:hypothetical protein
MEEKEWSTLPLRLWLPKIASGQKNHKQKKKINYRQKNHPGFHWNERQTLLSLELTISTDFSIFARKREVGTITSFTL